MANRIASQGGKLQIEISSVYTEIDGFASMTFSGGDRSEINATAINDTTAKSVAGLPNPLTAEVEILYDPLDTAHQALITKAAAGAVEDWRYLFPATVSPARKMDFSGQMTGFIRQVAESNGLLKANFKITVSSGPTEAAVA